MKIGRLNRASFAKTARRAMFLFAFAALGAQAAAGTVSVSYELNGKTVSFSGETLREVNNQMRTYWEVNGDGCAYNAEKLPADGTGTLTWTVSGTVEQGDYLDGGALVLPSLSGGYIYRDGTYQWKKIEVKADAPGATIISNPTFDVWHSYLSTGTNTTTVTGVTLQGGLYVVPHGTVTFDGCTFTGQLRVPNGDGAFAVTGCTFTGTTAAQDSNGYVMHYQAAGTLAFTGNTVADGYRRGLNIDNKDLTATVEKNKLGTTTDAGRSAIQISKCVKLAVTGNEIKLNGGNAFTFHETLLGLSAAPEVSISGNTVTGTGYLVYDDAVANGKAFTSDSLKLTYAADNVVAATVNTTQGVKGSTEYALSGTVATTLHSVDFAAFVKALTDAGYTFDGSKHARAQNGKLTVKWSPVSGCYDTRAHVCTVGNVAATANTPKRVNSGLTQFQLFEGESHAVNVKNVAFVYEPAAFTVCENSDWKGTFTAEKAPAGQIFLMNTGDVTFEGCTFDKVVLTSFNCTGTSTVKDCSFKNVYNSYAVKDIRGAKVAVTGCTFENCGAAVMVSSTVKVGAVTISGNTFKNVDVAGTAPDDRVGTRGLVQIASSGDYADTAFDFSDNTATDCGPVLRQLNTTVSFGTEEKAQLNTLASAGGSLYTTDSIKRVVAKVGETAYETLDEAIKAVRDGETIVVNAGEYKLNGSLTYTGKAFTIQAAEGAKVSFDMSGAVALHGAKITFAGVTFDYKTNGNYIGLQHADTLVYNDCTINGMVFLYAASETFNRCTFNQTSAGAYNVWTYGAKEVAFNVCTFNCVGKSVFVYNEGANTKTDLAVSDCEFKASAPVEGKAAIEIDTSLMAGGATITVDAKTTAEGFAEGSNSKSTLWNDKKQTQDTNRNTTVTVAGETVFTPVVAQVGTAGYTTLAAAFAALSAENHTLALLNEGAWDAATPVYWAAGAQNGYVATFTDALTAAYKANVGAITVVCRPGADVGEMTHGHVADDLTIYGNDAFISGGECDLEVDTYTFSRATGKQATDGVCLDKDITITAYELDNLGVWGERHTANKVTVNLTDCDGKALEGKTNLQRVYISGTTGVNDITLTDCDFLTKATAVYSNADGAIKAVNCSFTGGQVPFNINHKANGTQTVAVENCTFTNCGDANGWKQFAAPLRLVNSGTGTQSAEVTGCAFADTVGANGDILLGDGRTGQASNDVELKVVDTAANIQAQKPGYYGVETVDATKKATATSPASGTLETSVAKLLPVDPRTLGYATSGKAEALPATPDMNGEVVNVTAAQAQYVLDGAYGPIDGKTINFTESINDTLILGRASKYDGSKTVYRHGSHAGEALSYADFIAYKNQSVWTESCYYERTVENVTFTANEGVTVKNFEADGGAHIYAGTAPVYDYVRDTGSWVTEGSCYFKRAILQNITFKGLTFKAKTDINTSESTTVYDGFTFKDCTFDLGTTADGNQAIRYYNENNNGNVKNLVVEGCTFKTCSQGVYTMQVKGITVKDSTFTQTGHNAIAIQSQGGDKGPCNHGEVVITGNTFKNIGDRIIRFNNVGQGTTVTITDNTADGNSGKLDKATGKREIVKATTLPVNAADSITASGNNWGENTVVEGVFIDDYATKLGTEACPYSREQFAAMTRADYITAQERLGGTLYVNVGNYAYEKNGVLGNGVRNDTTGQVPDHSKLNAYGENGYLGEKNDGANGHAVVFVGGTITSDVTGYTSIDSIGTSLLLAVPAYTKVTFKETAFKNVLSFDYQLYTSPWSQLGGLTFNGCTFDGIIVGAIAAQELAFNGCTFNNYVNTTDANSSNPTWIRPAYGNWTKGDNEGQGTGFRSLTKITFENNKVTSTRPVKFERIAQWEMATTVTATNNTFAITPQEGDKDEKKTKNVGLYFGANAKFDLVIDENKKSGETAALYTAVYSAPNDGTYAGLPAGSTVKNTAGEEVPTGDGDALAWKTTKKITLKTTTAVASVTNAKGVSVNFATLADAIAAAQAGETVTLLADVESVSVTTVVVGKDIVLDLNGKTLTSTANNGITIEATAKLTVKDSLTGGKVVATGKYSNAIENKGTLVIESGSFEAVYGAIRALGGSTTTISGGTFASSTGRYGMYYWANGTALSVTVNGGLFKNPVSTAMENGKVALSIKGGSFASDLTDYCGADAGTYLDKETGLYVYGRESEHVPEGYVVDENGNVTISDEESLFWFAQQVNVRGNTFTGKTVSLADDIALTAKWTPVGVSVEKSFKGTFDGKDHAITGMKVSGASQAYGYGFFKLVISATVKNVTFTQAEVRSEYSNVVGCVAGYSYGSSTFENVHVTDSLVYAFGKVGGFVGMAEDAGATTTFRNCSVEATTIHGGYNVAGFCGLVMGTCAFSGSSLTDVTPVVDEDSQGFGKVVELDTTVVCDGSVATCAGTGTSIKGRYIPNNGYYWSAYSDLYNHYGDSKHDCTLADGKMLANSEVVHDAPVAIGDARYSDLQAAFDAAKTGDTVTLLSDITLTEQVNITKALDGLTLDGNGKTIVCATTDDPLKSGGSALYFGNANDHLYCTGIKIKDLTMTGTARFAIFLCGGTTTEFTNVKVSGNYYIAVNLYGTHGATMTNCDISNSTKGTDKYISAIWSNVASANPLTLNNSKVDVIAINTYTTANKLEPKIFVMDGSEVGEIHTFDDGSVSGNKKLCVSDGSTGSYVVKEYDEATSTWVNLRVAQIGTVGYETLEAALAAATDGDTITLLADVTVAEQLVVEKPLTLDLGGKTVTSTYAIPASLSSGEARYALLTKAPVTVTTGAFAAGQARALGAYANLTLTDATVTSELIGGHCCVAFCAAGGIYTVANATIKGDYAIANFAHNATIAITGSALEGSGCGLYHNGSNYGLKLTVSDTTINGAIDQAIGEGKDPSGVYLSGSLDVLANAENQNGAKGRHQATFTRCTIKGNTGVEVKYTDLTLEDCTVVATTEVPSYTQNNNGMAALGFAVVSTDNATGNATPKPEGTITITGADGSYTGLVGLGSLDSVKTGFADFEDAHYAVSGGTFSDAVLPEYCAAGFIPTANDDGTYGVKEGAYVAAIGTTGYETLEAALAAAQAGETVKMLADVTLTAKQTIAKALVLDLNGKTISSTAYRTLSLGSGANVTIQDSSAEKTGKVANGYKGSGDPYTICLDGYSAAELTLVSGTVEANPHKTDLQSVAINTNHEKDGPYAINIRGGKVFVPESSTNGRAIVAGENVTLTVEGGEIVGGLHGVDVYGGSTTAITGGSISARVVDTGVIKAAYGLRAKGKASVTIGAADGTADVVSVAGIKMDDNGYKLDVPAVTVNSGTIAGPVYSITPGTIVFNVQATSEDVLRFADDTAAKFLPSNLELRAKDIDGKTMYYVAAKPVAAIGAIGYETLEAALAAAKDGETVKLLADVTESVTIAADRTLTLDLNGKTLSAGKASEALTVTGYLTIDDTSATKSGRVVGDGQYAVYMNNRTAHVGESVVGGSLTLNAGSLEGATYGVYIRANQATLTMNGGKVSATKEAIRTANDCHVKAISLLGGEVGDVFLGSDSNTELTTLTVGKADQTDPAAVKVGKIGLQFNTGLFKLELYNGLVGELPEIGSCTATYTALGMLVKSDANCPSGKVFEAIAYNGETWYRIAALQKIAITFDGSKTVALPFATDWLKAHVGKGEASWTTEALEEKATNGLAKWQCYLFGLDPRKEDAKVVATAGQGTDKAIPLTVANADASASPLVKGGYVTVAYVLMGSNDGTAWTQVATSDKRDGLAIPLTGTTYKFYRVDVTVTSAEGN